MIDPTFAKLNAALYAARLVWVADDTSQNRAAYYSARTALDLYEASARLASLQARKT